MPQPSSSSSSSANPSFRKRREDHVEQKAAESQASSTAKSKAPSGSWQSLGVSAPLARSLNLRGFKNPTPIQRATIPHTLASSPRDILGMARTGSGKTLAYLIPLLERLQGGHSSTFGARALILCPNRELALQIYQVGKDLSRGLAKAYGQGQRDLRWVSLMGGERLDTQFDALANNPDVIIATPGRFLHLVIEMDMDLKSLELVVYDEADRLFELGFETQLTELQHRLPGSRHSLLFSATLPSSVAEFANAGLKDPELVRLDAEHRINPDVKLSFLSMTAAEKEGALLVLLRDIIKLPTAASAQSSGPQAIVFVSTKHHVEYVSALLLHRGYRVSRIYGSLDQIARRQQLDQFRHRATDLLVVTDVAARGLDIPVLDNVINFDFPSGVRLFVHRVGRTGRAGQKGTAWSLISRDELPFLFDLELFLGTPLIDATEQIFGSLPRDVLDMEMEHLKSSDASESTDLPSLREVMVKGEAMFQRSRAKASREAYRRTKSFITESKESVKVHPVFGSIVSVHDEQQVKQRTLLDSVNAYRPIETVFEMGVRGANPGAAIMKRRRTENEKRQSKVVVKPSQDDQHERIRKAPKSFRDSSFCLPTERSNAEVDKGYSLQDGASFAEKSRSMTLDLHNDEKITNRVQKASQLKWNKKSKRFVQGDGVGSDNQKLIRGESGALLPATFKSGRFQAWQAKRRSGIPGIGETESTSMSSNGARQSSKVGSGNVRASELGSSHSIRARRQTQQRRTQRLEKNSRKPRSR